MRTPSTIVIIIIVKCQKILFFDIKYYQHLKLIILQPVLKSDSPSDVSVRYI